jgi:hypothetical protein
MKGLIVAGVSALALAGCVAVPYGGDPYYAAEPYPYYYPAPTIGVGVGFSSGGHGHYRRHHHHHRRGYRR